MAITETFEPTEIWTPESNTFDYGAAIEAARREMNAKNPKQLIAKLKKTVNHSAEGVDYAILKGDNPSEYSSTEALVMFNPFANSASPNMLVRAEFIREAAKFAGVTDDAGKLKPVVMIASPAAFRGSKLDLTLEDKSQIRHGDLGPAARELLTVVAHKEFGTVALLGFSQGADMALAGVAEAKAANLDTSSVSIGEPAANQERSARELGLDFLKAGSTFQKAVSATELKAQTEAIGKNSLSLKRNADFMRFGISAVSMSANRALWNGLRHDRVEQKLEEILQDGTVDKLVVGYGAESAIAPPETMEPMLQRLHDQIQNNEQLISIRVEGATHAWGDQLTLLAKLYLKALV